MTGAGANQHPQSRWWLRLLVLAALGALAEYSGRPSPVLRARLDHALELFALGVAPVIITTGGAAADPSFSEGGVGRDYLVRHGVPTITFGAGQNKVHTVDEYVNVNDYLEGCRLALALATLP